MELRSILTLLWNFSNCAHLTFILFTITALPGQSDSADPVIQCPHPAVPIYATMTLSSDVREVGTTVTYSCDDGYELFGNPMRACLPDGKWSKEIPYCAVNVAYGKPTNQSSTFRGGDASHANDGDLTTVHENKYCTETRTENSPWWQVDLLQTYPVRVVRIVTRGCCGHQPLQDLEIRVGNSSVMQGNRLCAWYPRTLDDGITQDFPCAYPIVGRYVFIQIVGIQGSLTLCEVMVFTTQEISSGRCGNQMEPLELTTFSRTCYEFQVQRGGSFQVAEEYCHARGGLMVHRVEDLTHNFIASELERRKDSLKSKLVWLGAQRDSGLRAKTWHWVNQEPVKQYLWAEDQPNNYNGQQNCVVLDGGRRWLWNDVTCDLDYLPWICQYSPSNCGSPDRQENSTFFEKDYRLGRTVLYHCPIGNMVVGDTERKCHSSGFWTGSAPTCKYVNCGPLKDTEFGKVIYSEERTTYNATAKYTCESNYTLVGNEFRWCQGDGKWNGSEPNCEYHWCPDLKPLINGSVELSGLHAGDEAKYRCDKGHKLLGNDTRRCQLGGFWTRTDPICLFVDCGLPSVVNNGNYHLIDHATMYLSRVTYRCNDNYTLEGNVERSCLENGKWSSHNPKCTLITCGEPEIPFGSYLENSTFTVNSEVHYKCEPGYKMEMPENAVRKCSSNGEWSGKSPTCTYVDCGRIQPLLKGEIQYANGTTHLHSIVIYSCSTGYKLIGTHLRYCSNDGKWTDNAPKCEEIRCAPPEVPKNATVVYGGNDRASADSFKIGSTVQYKCIAGHLVKGEPLRTCQSTGVWSLDPPNCLYVDCGLPPPVPHGHWLLPSNTTYYASQVEYVCDINFELRGPHRRLCLENSTWSSSEPVCNVVSCRVPEKKDNHTFIEGNNFVVKHQVTYSCMEGYKLIGNANRICQSDGIWSGETPHCKLVDCSSPSAIANGQGFLVNGTTTFQSLVQYRCLPDFQMIGEPSRICLAKGEWSLDEPKCIDIVLDIDNNIDGHYADGQDADTSKTIGIAIAVGAGALLIIIIIVAVVCMKTHRAKVVKGNSNPAIAHEDKDLTTLRAYPRLALEAESHNNNSLNGNGAIRNNPNGLVTFSSNPQPIYVNVSANGHNAEGIQMQTSRQLRNGVIQSESL